MQAAIRRNKLAHVEFIDPASPQIGGVESLITDHLRLNSNVGLVGVTKVKKLESGEPTRQFPNSLESINFMSVSKIRATKRTLIPDSLKLAAGLINRRKALQRDIAYICHRFEIGALMNILGFRVIQFVHNESAGLLGVKSESRWRLFAPAFNLIRFYAASHAEKVVAFNRSEAEDLRAHGIDAYYQQSWFDDELFFNNQRNDYESDEDVVNLLWVGRFESQKNPTFAIEVAKQLVENKSKFELTMIGAGSLLRVCENLVKEYSLEDRVHFLGAQSRNQVADAMKYSDALLLTSHSEGSPLVLAEAGAVGLPCITTASADSDGFIHNGENGYCIQNFDPSAFAKAAIDSHKISASKCQQMAKNRAKSTILPKLNSMLEVM